MRQVMWTCPMNAAGRGRLLSLPVCLLSLVRARAGTAAAAYSVAALLRLPLLRSRTDSCSSTGTGSTSGSAREGAESVALVSCSLRLLSIMSETRPMSGDIDEIRTWLSDEAEGTGWPPPPIAAPVSADRPGTALDGARGCPVVEVVFTEL